ncbi:hypothetical protein OG589_14575 [Sphaerisporangium sp. NBC_01403]|uniref:hypothetical protein n=1 Tax=Sphaerisporangium sp. NBC_01403 TaxID=2903599 RepID=UPI0032484AF7
MVLTIPVEQIQGEARARKVDVRKALLTVGRALLTVLLGVPYVLGWALRKVWMVLVTVVTILGTAAAVGWRDAARPRAKSGGADE